MKNGTYTLIENETDLPSVAYTTPCGKTVKIADIFDLGSPDERVQFSADFPNGSIPRNTIIQVAALLSAHQRGE